MSPIKPTQRPAWAFVIASSLCATGLAQEPAPPPAGAAKEAAPVPAFRAEGAPVQPETPADPAAAKADPAEKPGAPATDTPAPTENPATPNLPAETGQVAPENVTQAQPDLTGGDVAPPSETVVINLIRRLVAKGLLTKEDAADLIKQAEADTAVARVQAQSDAAAVATLVVKEAVAAGKIEAAPDPMEESMRIPYIPEVVKKQIRDEIRNDIVGYAKSEGWSGATKIPEWVSKFRVAGDMRLRYEGAYFPSGNDNTGAFPNFNSINSGAPFDVAGTVFSPQLNVDRDRQRYRIRARVGSEIDMGDGFTAGFRLATGQDTSPVTTNQSVGAGTGQFSKYAIWLDRAFLRYEVVGEDGLVSLAGGRFDNPFMVTDTIFDDDLGFDGAAIHANKKIGKAFKPFVTAGAFPIYNTDFNFSSNQPAKFDSTDKYLYAVQVGTNAKLTEKLTLKIAGAYYHFDGVRGEQSTPYTPLNSSDAGDTDGTRPSFAQKGNTYIPLRRIIPNASNNFGTTSQFQYFGLGTEFRPLAITGRLDYNGFEPVQVSIVGEYIRNLGFDRDRLDALGVNNRASVSANGTPGSYAGGDTAWMAGVRVGTPAFQKRGDWQVGAFYKHIESDAVIDGFNDSDFGLGGTNMKGFALWGTWAVSPRTTFGVKWISASEIAGAPFRSDTLQVDFGGKF